MGKSSSSDELAIGSDFTTIGESHYTPKDRTEKHGAIATTALYDTCGISG